MIHNIGNAGKQFWVQWTTILQFWKPLSYLIHILAEISINRFRAFPVSDECSSSIHCPVSGDSEIIWTDTNRVRDSSNWENNHCYQTRLIFMLPCQAASNGGPTIANKKEQTWKAPLNEYWVYLQFMHFKAFCVHSLLSHDFICILSDLFHLC